MKVISYSNKVDSKTIDLYDSIDGLEVIREFLLFKGTDDFKEHVPLKKLEQMTLIHYGLKLNATNKLYVGWCLEKFYKRNGLINTKNRSLINIPIQIWNEVDLEHKKYQNIEDEK